MTEKKILEKDIQREICEWLAKNGFFFWRQNTMPVFAMSGSGTRKFRAMPKYALKGLPDIMIISQGTFIGLEVKRPKHINKREEQEITGAKIKENGGHYFVVNSLAQVQDIFDIGQFFPTSQP